MADIFEGLEKFGLKAVAAACLNTEKAAQTRKSAKLPGSKEADNLEESIQKIVYEKEFLCPVCEKNFKTKLLRSGKLRLSYVEPDLHPVYTPVDPLFYDVIVCENCGYSATKQQFLNLSDTQAELIAEAFGKSYKRVHYPDELTYPLLIERYKLALLCAYLKRAKNGERAYLALKISWMYRLNGDEKGELLFSQQAYDGFLAAYGAEALPVMGLDEPSLQYIMGVLAKKLKNYEDALRCLSKVVLHKQANERLKERARDLKNEIARERQTS